MVGTSVMKEFKGNLEINIKIIRLSFFNILMPGGDKKVTHT